MPYCAGCGSEVGAGVAFCPKCGRSTGVAGAPAAGAPAGGASAAAGSGLEENVAALLSYVLGWLTGLIFFLIDKRPYVRFHAMQSIITFGGLHLIWIVLMFGGFVGMGGFMGGMFGSFALGGIMWLIYGLFNLLILVVWVLCMVKAYQGQRFKLPIVGNIAEGYAK